MYYDLWDNGQWFSKNKPYISRNFKTTLYHDKQQ